MTPVLTRLTTLLALIALGFVLSAIEVPAHPGALAAMLVGFTLLVAYVAGALAVASRLPRLTGYVLSGMLIGPFVLGVLEPGMVESLRTIDNVALALIALAAGGEIRVAQLRRMLRSVVSVSVGVMVVVTVGIAVLVVVARPVVPMLAERPFGFTIAVALLLGIWCANSSPDATVAIINESGARGDFTEALLGVTILKDVLVIISFATAIAIARPMIEPNASFDAALIGTIAWEVFGALIIGGIAGLVFALYLDRVGARTVLATLVFAFFLTLLSDRLHLELLLTGVGAGFVIENFSKVGDELISAVERNATAVFALFFALAGATLDLGALTRFWPYALVVVAVRAALTWAGTRAGARLGRTSPEISGRMWMGLISQAGVTLGLSLLVGRQFPAWGQEFVTVTAAIIIVHLLVGPVLLKVALTQAGETEGGSDRPAAAREQLSDVVRS